MKKSLGILSVLFLSIISPLVINANLINEEYQVIVSPESGSWEAAVGDSLFFNIQVLRYNIPVSDADVEFALSNDGMPPFRTESAVLSDGTARIYAGLAETPGFVRCKASFAANNKSYTSLGTYAVDPEQIEPTQSMPEDFLQFWQNVLENARATDLDPVMELLPQRSTADVNVYRVSFNVGSGMGRIHGMLAVPSQPGQYPALVHYPGAGVYAIGPAMEYARQGVISLCIGINGVPVDMPDQVYADLAAGALNGYPLFNVDNRDRYYYKRVITGAVRAVDFVLQLPQCNGNVATYGGSQGGFLSIAVTALHPQVKALVANFPAMSDHSGFLSNRSGGWPGVLRTQERRTPQIMETLPYYDTVNFARLINVPGCYAYGYNDLTCAPTSILSVYNSITAPRTIITAPTTGHSLTLEQKTQTTTWIINQLKEE